MNSTRSPASSPRARRTWEGMVIWPFEVRVATAILFLPASPYNIVRNVANVKDQGCIAQGFRNANRAHRTLRFMRESGTARDRNIIIGGESPVLTRGDLEGDRGGRRHAIISIRLNVVTSRLIL